MHNKNIIHNFPPAFWKGVMRSSINGFSLSTSTLGMTLYATLYKLMGWKCVTSSGKDFTLYKLRVIYAWLRDFRRKLEWKKKNYTIFCNDSNIVSWFLMNGIFKKKKTSKKRVIWCQTMEIYLWWPMSCSWFLKNEVFS